jgi:hypothetical protein
LGRASVEERLVEPAPSELLVVLTPDSLETTFADRLPRASGIEIKHFALTWTIREARSQQTSDTHPKPNPQRNLPHPRERNAKAHNREREYIVQPSGERANQGEEGGEGVGEDLALVIFEEDTVCEGESPDEELEDVGGGEEGPCSDTPVLGNGGRRREGKEREREGGISFETIGAQKGQGKEMLTIGGRSACEEISS